MRFVSTEFELRQIARFRYSIYIEEMKRQQLDADHRRMWILDHLDQEAFVIGAWSQEQLIGTVRVNFCEYSDIGIYKEWYDAERVAGPHWPNSTAVISRLMVSKSHRGTIAGTRLSTIMFQLGNAKGIQCALMDCNEHLIPYFRKLGWRMEGSFTHPDYGLVFTHSLDLSDHRHLTNCQSPFLRTLRSNRSKELASLRLQKPLSDALFKAVISDLVL